MVAGARAMLEVLLNLFPRQQTRLHQAWLEFAGMYPAPPVPAAPVSSPASEEFGVQVARAHLTSRESDQFGDAYAPVARCDHRPDPLNPEQGYHGTTYGLNPLFAGNQTKLLAPHPGCSVGTPDHAAYLASLERVRKAGAAVGSTRTHDQTLIGLYWAYDGAHKIGTPPRLYNQIVWAVLDKLATAPIQKMLDEAQKIRLFGLVNCAMGNAGIRAWHNKYHYRLWRPVLGVREHDSALGPQAVANQPVANGPGDPFWSPLGAPKTNTQDPSFTPNFPAYPSGHATFGAATFQVVRNYLHREFGAAISGFKKPRSRQPDQLGFIFVSDELDGQSTDVQTGVRVRHKREYPSLWKAIKDNGESRIFLGVHWDFDAALAGDDHYAQFIGGTPLGLDIADDLDENGMVRQ